MKTITKWQANDGSEWDSPECATKRDTLIAEVAAVMDPMGQRVTDHGGHKQHTGSVVETVRDGLYAIANRDGILKWWINDQKSKFSKTDADLIRCHPSWFCRMLDGGHAPLERAYGRLCCIDKMYREWDQPYFANKADEETTK